MGFEQTLNETIHIEKKLYNKIVDSKDRNNGLDAFIEKKKPKWSGK